MSVAVVPQPNVNQGFAKGPGESLYSNLWRGLVSLWLPGIRTGGTGTDGARDFSGHKNHGTLNGTMTSSDWVVNRWGRSGQGGYALDFDGSDDVVLAGVNPIITTNKLTIMAWINPGVLTRGDIVTKWRSGGFAGDQFNLLYGVISGKPQFFISDGVATDDSGTGASTMAVGQWHHVVGTWDGATIRVYLDGTEESSGASVKVLDTTAGTAYRVGDNEDGAGTLTGQISDVRIYNRILSGSELRQTYAGASPLTRSRAKLLLPAAQTLTRSPIRRTWHPNTTVSYARNRGEALFPNLWDNLVGLWLPGIKDGLTTAKDYSGFNNNGVLTGSMTTTDWVISRSHGYALDFDGTDDSVNAGSNSSIDNIQIYTILAWVKYQGPNASENHYVASKNGTDRVYLGLQDTVTNPNTFYGFVGASSNMQYRSPDNAIPDNEWVHLAVTFDDSRGDTNRFELYKNGVKLAVDVLGEGAAPLNDDSAGDLIIGSRTTDNNRVFQGLISDVRLYNRILSSNEIRQTYAGASPLILNTARLAKARAVGPVFWHHYQTLRRP